MFDMMPSVRFIIIEVRSKVSSTQAVFAGQNEGQITTKALYGSSVPVQAVSNFFMRFTVRSL